MRRGTTPIPPLTSCPTARRQRLDDAPVDTRRARAGTPLRRLRPSLNSGGSAGRLYVPAEWVDAQTGQGDGASGRRCALYVRESSSENKGALQSQADGLKACASARGYQIVHVVHEIASGMNDERPKLHRLIGQRDFDVLLVEHKDRLTRFGFRWFEALAPFRIEVVNVAEEATHDLMEDLVAVITSFAARLYGKRRGRKRTQAAIEALKS